MISDKEIESVIDLYKYFHKYRKNSREQIYTHIQESLMLNQFKLHYDDDELYGFTNWAFMNKKCSDHYKKTGQMLFHFWNSGDIAWHIDTVAKKNVIKIHKWTKDYFTEKLGVGGELSWLRVGDDCKVYGESKWRYLGNGKYSK